MAYTVTLLLTVVPIAAGDGRLNAKLSHSKLSVFNAVARRNMYRFYYPGFGKELVSTNIAEGSHL